MCFHFEVQLKWRWNNYITLIYTWIVFAVIATTKAPSLHRERDAERWLHSLSCFYFWISSPHSLKKTEHAKTDAGLIHANSCGVVKAKSICIQLKGSGDETLSVHHRPCKCIAWHQPWRVLASACSCLFSSVRDLERLTSALLRNVLPCFLTFLTKCDGHWLAGS